MPVVFFCYFFYDHVLPKLPFDMLLFSKASLSSPDCSFSLGPSSSPSDLLFCLFESAEVESKDFWDSFMMRCLYSRKSWVRKVDGDCLKGESGLPSSLLVTVVMLYDGRSDDICFFDSFRGFGDVYLFILLSLTCDRKYASLITFLSPRSVSNARISCLAVSGICAF